MDIFKNINFDEYLAIRNDQERIKGIGYEIMKGKIQNDACKTTMFPSNYEKSVFFAIKSLFQEKNEVWHFINQIGLLFEAWLKDIGKKLNCNGLHEQIFKGTVDCITDANPDYVLMNKNRGLFFLIDYKNDKKYKKAQDFFEKAVCEVNKFMTLLTLINSDHKCLPFYIGIHLPSENDIRIEKEKNCFIFTKDTLRNLIEFIESKSINEIKDNFHDLMKFIVGLNEHYNPMSLIKEKAQISIDQKIKVFPELFPLTTSESKKKKERELYDVLKKFVNKKNGEWYLIYRIDKVLKTWLESLKIQGYYQYLLELAKKEAKCEHGFDPDFIFNFQIGKC